MRIVKVNKDSIANILSDLLKRSPTNYGDFQDKVDAIIKNVRDNGDKAVFDYTAQFDKAEINADNILVTEEEIKEVKEQITFMKESAKRSRIFVISMKNRFRRAGLRQEKTE